MYARGILFGKMKYELGDHAIVRCPETGLEADIEFKVKGWVAGTYNAIGGFIKESSSGKNLYELSGLWHGEMFIKDLSTGKKELLFDATNAKASYPKARPLHQQHARESQKLWDSTTKAIKKADQKVATDEKSRIEDEQRKEAAERGEAAWEPKLFKRAPPGDEEKLDWILNTDIDTSVPPAEQVKQILAIVPIVPDEELAQTSANTKELPIGQGKPPVQEPQKNLVDSSQHDVAATTTAPREAVAQPQKPLQSSRKDRVVRLDSTSGGEETFHDAEM